MSAPRPMGDPFACLSEECSELIKEHMKLLRFPPETTDYSEWVAAGNAPPRERLVQEIGDVLAAIDVLVHRGLLTDLEVRTAKYRKLSAMRERYGEEQVFGTPAPSAFAGVSG